MVYGFSHSLTLEAVASHHPISRIVSRGFISFDVSSYHAYREVCPEDPLAFIV
jgi:hypothetical protein